MAVTADQVRALLTGSGLRDGTGTAADMSDDALAGQVDLAHVYTASRLPAGVSDAHPLVEQVIAAIAAYHATLSYRQGLDLPDLDTVALRYAWAMRTLGEIASGVVVIAEGGGGAGAAGAVSGVINPCAGELFPVPVWPGEPFMRWPR